MLPGMLAHALILTLGKQRQGDPCEFEATLVYTVSSRATQEKPCLNPSPQKAVCMLVIYLYSTSLPSRDLNSTGPSNLHLTYHPSQYCRRKKGQWQGLGEKQQ